MCRRKKYVRRNKNFLCSEILRSWRGYFFSSDPFRLKVRYDRNNKMIDYVKSVSSLRLRTIASRAFLIQNSSNSCVIPYTCPDTSPYKGPSSFNFSRKWSFFHYMNISKFYTPSDRTVNSLINCSQGFNINNYTIGRNEDWDRIDVMKGVSRGVVKGRARFFGRYVKNLKLRNIFLDYSNHMKTLSRFRSKLALGKRVLAKRKLVKKHKKAMALVKALDRNKNLLKTVTSAVQTSPYRWSMNVKGKRFNFLKSLINFGKVGKKRKKNFTKLTLLPISFLLNNKILSGEVTNWDNNFITCYNFHDFLTKYLNKKGLKSYSKYREVKKRRFSKSESAFWKNFYFSVKKGFKEDFLKKYLEGFRYSKIMSQYGKNKIRRLERIYTVNSECVGSVEDFLVSMNKNFYENREWFSRIYSSRWRYSCLTASDKMILDDLSPRRRFPWTYDLPWESRNQPSSMIEALKFGEANYSIWAEFCRRTDRKIPNLERDNYFFMFLYKEVIDFIRLVKYRDKEYKSFIVLNKNYVVSKLYFKVDVTAFFNECFSKGIKVYLYVKRTFLYNVPIAWLRKGNVRSFKLTKGVYFSNLKDVTTHICDTIGKGSLDTLKDIRILDLVYKDFYSKDNKKINESMSLRRYFNWIKCKKKLLDIDTVITYWRKRDLKGFYKGVKDFCVKYPDFKGVENVPSYKNIEKIRDLCFKEFCSVNSTVNHRNMFLKLKPTKDVNKKILGRRYYSKRKQPNHGFLLFQKAQEIDFKGDLRAEKLWMSLRIDDPFERTYLGCPDNYYWRQRKLNIGIFMRERNQHRKNIGIRIKSYKKVYKDVLKTVNAEIKTSSNCSKNVRVDLYKKKLYDFEEFFRLADIFRKVWSRKAWLDNRKKNKLNRKKSKSGDIYRKCNENRKSDTKFIFRGFLKFVHSREIYPYFCNIKDFDLHMYKLRPKNKCELGFGKSCKTVSNINTKFKNLTGRICLFYEFLGKDLEYKEEPSVLNSVCNSFFAYIARIQKIKPRDVLIMYRFRYRLVSEILSSFIETHCFKNTTPEVKKEFLDNVNFHFFGGTDFESHLKYCDTKKPDKGLSNVWTPYSSNRNGSQIFKGIRSFSTKRKVKKNYEQKRKNSQKSLLNKQFLKNMAFGYSCADKGLKNILKKLNLEKGFERHVFLVALNSGENYEYPGNSIVPKLLTQEKSVKEEKLEEKFYNIWDIIKSNLYSAEKNSQIPVDSRKKIFMSGCYKDLLKQYMHPSSPLKYSEKIRSDNKKLCSITCDIVSGTQSRKFIARSMKELKLKIGKWGTIYLYYVGDSDLYRILEYLLLKAHNRRKKVLLEIEKQSVFVGYKEDELTYNLSIKTGLPIKGSKIVISILYYSYKSLISILDDFVETLFLHRFYLQKHDRNNILKVIGCRVDKGLLKHRLGFPSKKLNPQTFKMYENIKTVNLDNLEFNDSVETLPVKYNRNRNFGVFYKSDRPMFVYQTGLYSFVIIDILRIFVGSVDGRFSAERAIFTHYIMHSIFSPYNRYKETSNNYGFFYYNKGDDCEKVVYEGIRHIVTKKGSKKPRPIYLSKRFKGNYRHKKNVNKYRKNNNIDFNFKNNRNKDRKFYQHLSNSELIKGKRHLLPRALDKSYFTIKRGGDIFFRRKKPLHTFRNSLNEYKHMVKGPEGFDSVVLDFFKSFYCVIKKDLSVKKISVDVKKRNQIFDHIHNKKALPFGFYGKFFQSYQGFNDKQLDKFLNISKQNKAHIKPLLNVYSCLNPKADLSRLNNPFVLIPVKDRKVLYSTKMVPVESGQNEFFNKFIELFKKICLHFYEGPDICIYIFGIAFFYDCTVNGQFIENVDEDIFLKDNYLLKIYCQEWFEYNAPLFIEKNYREFLTRIACADGILKTEGKIHTVSEYLRIEETYFIVFNAIKDKRYIDKPLLKKLNPAHTFVSLSGKRFSLPTKFICKFGNIFRSFSTRKKNKKSLRQIYEENNPPTVKVVENRKLKDVRSGYFYGKNAFKYNKNYKNNKPKYNKKYKYQSFNYKNKNKTIKIEDRLKFKLKPFRKNNKFGNTGIDKSVQKKYKDSSMNNKLNYKDKKFNNIDKFKGKEFISYNKNKKSIYNRYNNKFYKYKNKHSKLNRRAKKVIISSFNPVKHTYQNNIKVLQYLKTKTASKKPVIYKHPVGFVKFYDKTFDSYVAKVVKVLRWKISKTLRVFPSWMWSLIYYKIILHVFNKKSSLENCNKINTLEKAFLRSNSNEQATMLRKKGFLNKKTLKSFDNISKKWNHRIGIGRGIEKDFSKFLKEFRRLGNAGTVKNVRKPLNSKSGKFKLCRKCFMYHVKVYKVSNRMFKNMYRLYYVLYRLRCPYGLNYLIKLDNLRLYLRNCQKSGVIWKNCLKSSSRLMIRFKYLLNEVFVKYPDKVRGIDLVRIKTLLNVIKIDNEILQKCLILLGVKSNLSFMFYKVGKGSIKLLTYKPKPFDKISKKGCSIGVYENYNILSNVENLEVPFYNVNKEINMLVSMKKRDIIEYCKKDSKIFKIFIAGRRKKRIKKALIASELFKYVFEYCYNALDNFFTKALVKNWPSRYFHVYNKKGPVGLSRYMQDSVGRKSIFVMHKICNLTKKEVNLNYRSALISKRSNAGVKNRYSIFFNKFLSKKALNLGRHFYGKNSFGNFTISLVFVGNFIKFYVYINNKLSTCITKEMVTPNYNNMFGLFQFILKKKYNKMYKILDKHTKTLISRKKIRIRRKKLSVSIFSKSLIFCLCWALNIWNDALLMDKLARKPDVIKEYKLYLKNIKRGDKKYLYSFFSRTLYLRMVRDVNIKRINPSPALTQILKGKTKSGKGCKVSDYLFFYKAIWFRRRRFVSRKEEISNVPFRKFESTIKNSYKDRLFVE